MSKTTTAKFQLTPGQPLTDEQIAFMVSTYQERGTIPGGKIVCNLTGKHTTCVGPWMRKKVEQFGGIENLLRNYTASKGVAKKTKVYAKKKDKPSKPSTSKKQSKSVETDVPKKGRTKKVREKSQRALKMEIKREMITNPPVFKTTPSRLLTKTELAEITKTSCLRPDIFLDNDRHCEYCPHYAYCENKLKNLSKGVSYENGEFVEHIISKRSKTNRK